MSSKPQPVAARASIKVEPVARYTVKCADCGQDFAAQSKNAQRCKPCRDKRANAIRKRPVNAQIRCGWCGTLFTPPKTDARYCKEDCSYQAHLARKRGSSSSLIPAELEAADADYSAPQHVIRRHPQGWEPGVEWDGVEGVLTSAPLPERPQSWDDLLQIWDLDPALYEVVEPVQFRAWDAAIGDGNVRRMYYYRATIRSRQSPSSAERTADIEELIAEVKRFKPRPPAKVQEGDAAFVVNLSDWQIGKADGDGVEGTVARLLALGESVRARYQELRRVGRNIGTLYIAGLGDLMERCTGNYPNQTFTVQLNNRDQRRLTRRILLKLIRTWVPDFVRVVVLAVPGNHGENRQGGKTYTDDADNDDVSIFEDVYDVLHELPGYEHVSFVIPHDEMEVVLDVGGTNVAWMHAHKAEGGGSSGLPQAKVRSWWQKQSFGERPAGDARILVSAHYHHLSLIDFGPKLHLQCPAMDGGSKWHQDREGVKSHSGTLTFVVRDDWAHDVAVL